MLHELVPKAALFAVLVNPEAFQRRLPLKDSAGSGPHPWAANPMVFHASTKRDIDTMFRLSVELQTGGQRIGGGWHYFFSRRGPIRRSSDTHPGSHRFYPWREAGGGWRVGKLRIKRHGPIALPVSTPAAFSKATSRLTCRSQRSTDTELVINMKTAKALGIALPLSLLGRADEVIE